MKFFFIFTKNKWISEVASKSELADTYARCLHDWCQTLFETEIPAEYQTEVANLILPLMCSGSQQMTDLCREFMVKNLSRIDWKKVELYLSENGQKADLLQMAKFAVLAYEKVPMCTSRLILFLIDSVRCQNSSKINIALSILTEIPGFALRFESVICQGLHKSLVTMIDKQKSDQELRSFVVNVLTALNDTDIQGSGSN